MSKKRKPGWEAFIAIQIFNQALGSLQGKNASPFPPQKLNENQMLEDVLLLQNVACAMTWKLKGLLRRCHQGSDLVFNNEGCHAQIVMIILTQFKEKKMEEGTFLSLILYFCSCFWKSESSLLRRLLWPLHLCVSLLLLLKRKVFTSSFFWYVPSPWSWSRKHERHSKQ